MTGPAMGRGEGFLRLAGNLGKRQFLFTGVGILVEYQGPLYGKSRLENDTDTEESKAERSDSIIWAPGTSYT